MARMYGALPNGHLKRLAKLYRRDLALFGYPFPGFALPDRRGAVQARQQQQRGQHDDRRRQARRRGQTEQRLRSGGGKAELLDSE